MLKCFLYKLQEIRRTAWLGRNTVIVVQKMNKFFSSLTDKLFSSRKLVMESESLLSLLKRDNHQSAPKEEIREYLQKHFDGNVFPKVKDFPSGE